MLSNTQITVEYFKYLRSKLSTERIIIMYLVWYDKRCIIQCFVFYMQCSQYIFDNIHFTCNAQYICAMSDMYMCNVKNIMGDILHKYIWSFTYVQCQKYLCDVWHNICNLEKHMFDVFETSEVHKGSWGARLNVLNCGIAELNSSWLRLDSNAIEPTDSLCSCFR